MKKKLFESIGGNMFKLKTNEDAFGSDGPSGHDHRRNPNDDEMNENSTVESDIEAQKAMYRNFEIDYSKGATFSNNLLALYGVGKRGTVWLTSFENDGGEPMSKEEIIATLNKVGLGKLSSEIPSDYESGEGFKGTHA
jgi:hypothetical protein